LYWNWKIIISGKYLRVQNYDYANSSTIEFEKSVRHKVRKRGSSRTMKNLYENILEWLKHKYRKMDSDNFDEFLKATKAVGNAGILIVMFNNLFKTKVRGNWYRDIRFVENDNFKVVNENQEYERLWDRVIPDQDERYGAIKLSGVGALFKGRRVTGLTFTRNDADLTTKKCYVLEAIEALQYGPE
jgi:hypothetical protein